MTDPLNTPEVPGEPQPLFTPPPGQSDNTASRGKRLAAVCIDWFIMILCLTPVVEYLGLRELVESYQPGQTPVPMTTELVLKMLAFQYGIFLLLNGFLLQHYGQTIGKRAMNIAIVDLEGRRVPLLNLILNRYVSQWALGLISGIGALLRLVDWLFIFRDGNRCLHDHIARTRVIDLGVPAAAANNNSLIA